MASVTLNPVKFEYYVRQLLRNFGAEMIIFPLATEGEMKNGVAYKKNVYQIR